MPGTVISLFILTLVTYSSLGQLARGSSSGTGKTLAFLTTGDPCPTPAPPSPPLLCCAPSSGWLCSSPLCLCHSALTPQSLEDLEDQKRKKKKEKMGFGSISRVFARGKQRKSLDPGLFDGTAPDYYIEEDADW